MSIIKITVSDSLGNITAHFNDDPLYGDRFYDHFRFSIDISKRLHAFKDTGKIRRIRDWLITVNIPFHEQDDKIYIHKTYLQQH